MKQHTKPAFVIRFFIFFAVAALVLVMGLVWWNDGISPVERGNTEDHQFSITTGESISSIAGRLSTERFIRSKTVFFLYTKYNALDNKIQAGNFTLQRSMDLPSLVNALTVGKTDIRITTLEGWRNEEIASKLSQELGIPEEEFLEYATEGYMFPDTYLLPQNATAAAVVDIFRKNFDKQITSEMMQEIAKQGRTLQEVVTLASLLEREGNSNEDRPVIAGILLKRMKAGWTLDVDATLQYAIGYQSKIRSWWKTDLTVQDKAINSPYNTYKNAGLPPGPISNPGLVSLKAAIFTTDSPYWFYLHDPQGKIHYAKTQEEQNANSAKYLSTSQN